MKKWLSRGIVLAMVFALMIPAPVLAKSSKSSAKLVKSVTYYEPAGEGQGWVVSRKTDYKYGKKKTPSEIKYTSYHATFLGVPVSGSSETYKIKYKKNKATEYDTAGFVTAKDVYKGGNLISWSVDRKSSKRKQKVDKTWYDDATFAAAVGHGSYFKNGLLKTEDFTASYLNSSGANGVYTANAVYAWAQKKGIPTLMYRTAVSTGNKEGSTRYALFNTKGLVIEEGDVDEDGKQIPDYAYTYTYKKGRVDTVICYDVDEDTKEPSPKFMAKFKYTKKSISKAYNLRVINSLLAEYGFYWYQGADYRYIPYQGLGD